MASSGIRIRKDVVGTITFGVADVNVRTLTAASAIAANTAWATWAASVAGATWATFTYTTLVTIAVGGAYPAGAPFPTSAALPPFSTGRGNSCSHLAERIRL